MDLFIQLIALMFSDIGIQSFYLLVGGYLVYLYLSKRRRKLKATQFFRDDNTPKELQQALLYGSEEHISCDTPIPLKGTYDQLYLTPQDRFILTDTKTRKKPNVYDSDIIQLSAYKVILENTPKFVSVKRSHL